MKNKGFSLVELLVSMVIFMLVVGVIYVVLRNIYRDYRTEVEKAESQVREILTFPLVPDLKNAGFGMPDNYSGCSGVDIPGESFGRVTCDCLAHANEPPKPICICNNAGVNESDVLVIHSSMARVNKYTRCYGYYLYSENVGLLSKDCPDELALSVLYIPPHEGNGSEGDVDRILKCSGDRYLFRKDEVPSIENIKGGETLYFLYGIGNSTDLLPFNTVVYYLREYENDTDRPAECCNCTGVLERAYRTNDGSFHPEPVMHCVLDFQVWVYNGSAYVDLEPRWKNDDIRKHIKSAVVFIVQQNQDGDVYENGTITLSYGGRRDVRDYGDDVKGCKWKILKYHVYLENLGVH